MDGPTSSIFFVGIFERGRYQNSKFKNPLPKTINLSKP